MRTNYTLPRTDLTAGMYLMRYFCLTKNLVAI